MSKHQNKFSYLKLGCKAQGIRDYTEIIFCNTPNNFPCIFYSTVQLLHLTAYSFTRKVLIFKCYKSINILIMPRTKAGEET